MTAPRERRAALTPPATNWQGRAPTVRLRRANAERADGKNDVGLCRKNARLDPAPALAFRASGKGLARLNRPIRAFIRPGLLNRQSTPARRSASVVDEKCCMLFAFI